MKRIVYFFFLTFITMAFPSLGQNKYAILIGGPIDKEHWKSQYNGGWFPEEYQDFFWTDIYLMRQLLINKFDYPQENVKVIFDNGQDYSPPQIPVSIHKGIKSCIHLILILLLLIICLVYTTR